MNDCLKEKLAQLPGSPGCYLMKQQGEILYVGKAKNLKHRVRSYFTGNEHSVKVAAMIQRVDDLDTVLCQTELEALLLESNLIKAHKPYFNILLKDDKHYPYIRIDTKAPYPRAEVVRKTETDGAKYFGPYRGATSLREVMECVRQTYPLRTCKRALNPEKPQRPCVNRDMGLCLGPCTGQVDPASYQAVVAEVVSFLSGKADGAVIGLKARMQEAATCLQYERAGQLRDAIRKIEGILEKQRVLLYEGGERDVIALCQDSLDGMAQVLSMREGKLLSSDSFALSRAGLDDPGEVMQSFLLQHYTSGLPIPREILLSVLPPEADIVSQLLSQVRGAKVTLACPQRGEKRAMVTMCEKNARDQLQVRNAVVAHKAERTTGACAALAEALGIEKTLRRIEGFDISNTQGRDSVASMVVFLDGAPAKREYRHYRIHTVEGANDFASMAEVVGRRFKRGLAEAPAAAGFGDLPDLILVDGGPEQLAFALRAMHTAGGDVPMLGLAKRLEEIFLPGVEAPLMLPRHSPALHLLQRVRDEAHRFGVTHHRALRAKTSTHSKLEDIPGIGPKRRASLYKAFGSLEALRAASVDALAQVPGMNRRAAEAVRTWLDTSKR